MRYIDGQLIIGDRSFSIQIEDTIIDQEQFSFDFNKETSAGMPDTNSINGIFNHIKKINPDFLFVDKMRKGHNIQLSTIISIFFEIKQVDASILSHTSLELAETKEFFREKFPYLCEIKRKYLPASYSNKPFYLGLWRLIKKKSYNHNQFMEHIENNIHTFFDITKETHGSKIENMILNFYFESEEACE